MNIDLREMRERLNKENRNELGTGAAGEGIPPAFAVIGDVIDQSYVLLHRPRSSPQVAVVFAAVEATGVESFLFTTVHFPAIGGPDPAAASIWFLI